MSDTPRSDTPPSGHDNPSDDSARLKAHLGRKAEEQFQRQMQEAAALLARGQGADAIPLLLRCYRLRPNDVIVLINLGGAYILAGKHRAAVPYLEQASELAPNNPAVWSNLAAASLGNLITSSRNRQDNALAAYRRVIELDAAYPNVHYNMGLIFVDRRDWDAAYDAFSRAIEANPHDSDARRMRDRVDIIRQRPPDPSMN